MDTRPPDTEGLGYVGESCRIGSHATCAGYWPDELHGQGRGSRCACPCHSEEVTPNETT
jgi:hypothetical protein